MKKKIIKMRDYQPYMTVGCGAGSNFGKNCYCELVFDDGSFVVVDFLELDGSPIKEGDEVYVYEEDCIISRSELSPKELKKIARHRKIGCTLAVVAALLFGIVAALLT